MCNTFRILLFQVIGEGDGNETIITSPGDEEILSSHADYEDTMKKQNEEKELVNSRVYCDSFHFVSCVCKR